MLKPSNKATKIKKTVKNRKIKKTSKLKWIFAIILLIIFSSVAYLLTPITSSKIVYIPQGSVFKSISHLQEDGVNLHAIDAVILRLLGHPQSGWVDLQKENLTRIEYLYKLTKAKAATHTITLIPGETTLIFLEQVAQQLTLDSVKLKEVYANTANSSEGLLVPDTYSVPKSINEEKLIVFLLKQSLEKQKKLSNKLLGYYDESKWLQLVTLSSVIQKEAASVEDMPMVSSVIHNRLKKDMRLQMDGTLNYGKYSHQKVTAARIRSDTTSYNTYKHRGLPDAPVCNVSYEALDAAMNPKRTDYLYFVRGKNGEHIYTSYFSTHHKNIVNATK